MTCEPATARFEDYLDAALPAIERQELDRHLRTCTRCRSELVRLQALRSMLAELPAPPAAPGALDSILRAAVRPAAASRPRWQDPRWFAPGVAAAAVLLIALGVRCRAQRLQVSMWCWWLSPCSWMTGLCNTWHYYFGPRMRCTTQIFPCGCRRMCRLRVAPGYGISAGTSI
jgi:predicted anti-sigma-YlaC factor YlaD